jgi:hypothetical protein
MSVQEPDPVTSIERSLSILTMDEKEQDIMEQAINREWSSIRDFITEKGHTDALTLKLMCSLCSVCPPQSVLVAIKRANSRIFAERDNKGRHPLHYLCHYGAPTFAIIYAAQCHIAALVQEDDMKKTPFELALTMPWQFCPEDKNEVIEELQQCKNMKCFDEKSKLPNKVALETWGHKVVIEEEIKCFMVVFVECARFENAPDWDGCCLLTVAKGIRDQCHSTADAVRKDGKIVYIDAYRLVSNQFVVVAKTQSKEDCEFVYSRLCLVDLAMYTHKSMFLRLGCTYTEELIGALTLREMVKEAEELQNGVKENLEKAAVAVSMALNDVGGNTKVNVSALTLSDLSKLVSKEFVPDKSVIKDA